MSYTVRAATDTAVSASISTPVCAVVSATRSDLDARVADLEEHLNKGISSDDRGDQLARSLPAMIPATCAVASTSPLRESPGAAPYLGHPHGRAGRGARRDIASYPTSTNAHITAFADVLNSRPVVDPNGQTAQRHDRAPQRLCVHRSDRARARGRGSPRAGLRSFALRTSARRSPSAWPSTSNGLTVRAHSRARHAHLRFQIGQRHRHARFTSGASFATRFMRSKIAFTSSTSNCLYAATDCGKLSAICKVDRPPPLC